MPMTHQPVKVVVEEIDSNYESYLAYLKERNKQRLLLQRKTEEDLEKERLEKGFQLYFNAAAKYLKNTSHEHNTSRYNKRNRSAPDMTKQKYKRKSWGDVVLPYSEILPLEQTTSSPRSAPKPVNCPNLLRNNEMNNKRNRSVSQLSYFLNNDHGDSLCNTNAFSHYTKKDGANCLVVEEKTDGKLTKVVFTFDIFNNWGDKNWVGLNGFEIKAHSTSSVQIYPEVASVYSLKSSQPSDSIIPSTQNKKLFKSSFNTTSLANMWLTNVENLPVRINFNCLLSQAYLEDTFTVNIWNFTQLNQSEIGVKNCLLKVMCADRSTVLYDGILQKGDETSIENSVTSIFLNISEILYPQEDDSSKCSRNNSSEYLKSSEMNQLNGVDMLNDNDKSDCIHSNDTVEQDSSSKLNVWFSDSHMIKSKHKDENIHLLSNVNTDLLNYSFHRINMKRRISGRDRINSLLEESWSSLDFFNHFHEGRISVRNDSQAKHNSCFHILEHPVAVDLPNSSFQSSKNESQKLRSHSSNEVELKSVDYTSAEYYPSRVDANDIVIPELPSGSRLLIDIISTWGDLYYVGLTGIEIFTSDGIDIASLCKITANPSDINTLPGYGNDPRVVTNLIDGVNWTRDDTHMWLTPFTAGQRHFIEITFPQSVTSPIALLRIWNYNKSRVHSYRGVREMIIYLDNQPIFYGEISKASGLEFGEPENFCETILFCTDNAILDLIGKNDSLLHLKESEHCSDTWLASDSEDSVKRPVTSISLSQDNNLDNNVEESETSFLPTEFSELVINDGYSAEMCKTCSVEIALLEPWVYGSEYIGLTGIEFFNKTGNPIKINRIQINDGSPVSPTIDNGNIRNYVENLLNSRNNTTDASEMWYTAYNSVSSPPVLKFYLDVEDSIFPSVLNGLRIWNYNDRQVGCDYGCKLINVKLKKSELILNESTVLLRQAPGHTDYPFGQTIKISEFQENGTMLHSLSSRIKYHNLPIGFVYQLNIFSSWGDQFYVGLDGVQFLSPEGNVIPISKNEIFAYPSSVNDLYPGEILLPDVRTVDKLVDNVIVSSANEMARHCWLAPILPRLINKIFIVFNKPICVAGIRLWNYTRTPERGVKEFSVLVDGQILFRSYLPKAENQLQSNNSLFTSRIQTTYQASFPWGSPQINPVRSFFTVAFDYDILIELGENPKFILSKYQSTEYSSDGDIIKEIDVYEKRSYCPRKAKINQALRPTTCVTNHKSKSVR
ncbi:unnamed protein product [Trichobilharzia szidati]|nr:unnamed protein product [Trichobilharzia szidati]